MLKINEGLASSAFNDEDDLQTSNIVGETISYVEDAETPFAEMLEQEIAEKCFASEGNQNAEDKQTKDNFQEINTCLSAEDLQEENKYKPDWLNSNDILLKTKPPFVHIKSIFETDTRFSKQGRKIFISDIVSSSYKATFSVEAHDEALSMSIDDVGLLNPIIVVTVKPSKKEKRSYRVIDGASRVRVLIEKGEDLVDAYVIEAEDKDLETVMQADLHLLQRERTAAEKIMWIKKRKTAYEKLYPETKAEKRRQIGLNVSDEKISSLARHETFTTLVSKLTGEHIRTIQMYSKAGDTISVENLELLKGSKLEDNFSELKILAKIKNDELQTNVIKMILNNEARNVREALGELLDQVMIIPSEVKKADTIALKNAKVKINELKQEVDKLKAEIKKLKSEQPQEPFYTQSVPELDLYPYTDMNKQSIQEEEIEEGGQDE